MRWSIKLIYGGGSSVRFAPPLVIEEEDLRKSIKIIGECLEDLDKVCTFCLLSLAIVPTCFRLCSWMSFQVMSEVSRGTRII
jgi:hypothetical protein